MTVWLNDYFVTQNYLGATAALFVAGDVHEFAVSFCLVHKHQWGEGGSMLGIIFGVTALGMAAGFIFKFLSDRQGVRQQITLPEYVVGSLIVLALVAPLTGWLGLHFAINSQVTYHENVGGWESRVRIVKHTCSRDDGVSKHTYEGEPYQVTVVDEDYTDKDGTHHHREHQETRYHTIPYTTEEWDYVVDTTLGEQVIAARNFPPNPSQYQFKWLVSVPNIPSETGPPPFWNQVKQRVEVERNPGPVTLRHDYANYILATQDKVLVQQSSAIDGFKKAGHLPKLATNLRSPYYCDRVYGVGYAAGFNWQNAINRFNAALSELQGDLHLVIVDSNTVTDANEFSLALIAYWTSPEFGKNALSKNAILVILGTKDGSTVEWARAHTGMPRGNEALLLEIQNKLPGSKLDPDSILGQPTAQVQGNSAMLTHTNGALEQLLWGRNKFTRVHMTKDGGYKYLLAEIRPSTGQVCLILFAGTLLSCIVWFIFFRCELPLYFK